MSYAKNIWDEEAEVVAAWEAKGEDDNFSI